MKEWYGSKGDPERLLVAIEIVRDRENEEPAPELDDKLTDREKMMEVRFWADSSSMAKVVGWRRCDL